MQAKAPDLASGRCPLANDRSGSGLSRGRQSFPFVASSLPESYLPPIRGACSELSEHGQISSLLLGCDDRGVRIIVLVIAVIEGELVGVAATDDSELFRETFVDTEELPAVDMSFRDCPGST